MGKEAKNTIKFTEDYEVQDEKRGTKDATFYKAGKKLKCTPETAWHFIRKGVAYDVDADKEQAAADTAAEKAEADAAAAKDALRAALGDEPPQPEPRGPGSRRTREAT